MKRKELQDLLNKTDTELAMLILTDTHKLENLQNQRDDAITRIANRDKEVINSESIHASTMKDLQSAHANAIKEMQSTQEKINAEKDAKITEQQILIETLGGTEMGQKMQKEKRKLEAMAKKEQAEKELKELE